MVNDAQDAHGPPLSRSISPSRCQEGHIDFAASLSDAVDAQSTPSKLHNRPDTPDTLLVERALELPDYLNLSSSPVTTPMSSPFANKTRQGAPARSSHHSVGCPH